MSEALGTAGALVAFLAALDFLASRYGRDSRDGDDWLIHRAGR